MPPCWNRTFNMALWRGFWFGFDIFKLMWWYKSKGMVNSPWGGRGVGGEGGGGWEYQHPTFQQRLQRWRGRQKRRRSRGRNWRWSACRGGEVVTRARRWRLHRGARSAPIRAGSQQTSKADKIRNCGVSILVKDRELTTRNREMERRKRS